MHRENSRKPVDGYCIQILIINDNVQEDLSNKLFYVSNISKGGFCFLAEIDLEIDDRVKVILRFPDDSSHEVMGRICYCNDLKDEQGHAYGFSVMDGFYSLGSGSGRIGV